MKRLIKRIMDKIRLKKRVLVYGDYRTATGFSTVTTNILKQFQSAFGTKYQVDVLAINWYGDRLPDDYEIKEDEASDIVEVDELHDGQVIKVKKRVRIYNKDFSVYSAYHTDGKEDVYGRNALLSLLTHVEYNLLFMVQDLGLIASILPGIKMIKEEKRKDLLSRKTKVMAYFPVDSDTLMPQWFEHFDVIDRPIAYTEYARDTIKAKYPQLGSHGKMPVILHGVDTSVFAPIREIDQDAFRLSFFGENSKKFIVGNINRNQPRKDIPTTILAFEDFHNQYPDTFLYLHMDPDDANGWDLKLLMMQTNLVQGKDYMFTPPDMIKETPEPGLLNCIYNSIDVYLTTTTGEGFGLTVVEALAAGVPVIAPYHTSLMEIAGSAVTPTFDLMTDFVPFVSHTDSMIRKAVTKEEVTERLAEMYNNRPNLTNNFMLGLSYARSIDWANANVGGRWIEEFKNML